MAEPSRPVLVGPFGIYLLVRVIEAIYRRYLLKRHGRKVLLWMKQGDLLRKYLR